MAPARHFQGGVGPWIPGCSLAVEIHINWRIGDWLDQDGLRKVEAEDAHIHVGLQLLAGCSDAHEQPEKKSGCAFPPVAGEHLLAILSKQHM